MEFGIFNAACLLPKYRARHGESAEHDRIMDEVAFIVAADKAGFKYTWASEHHFLTDYSHLSASESFLAFVADKTSNIHIGSGIFNLTPPVNHPARIAERVAMLDHLSEGRFEFGTGRGSSTTEQRGFGIDDPDLTREMVAEVLPQIVRMWKEDEYSYDGTFFSMPPRNVLPKPYSSPHPPIWMAAGSPSTFDLAAELGVGVLCFGFSTPGQLTPLVARYKEKIQDCTTPVGGFVNDNVMITTQMICMEDGAKARAAFMESETNYHLSLVFRYLDTFPKPSGLPEWPAIIPALDAETLDAVIASGNIAVGTPDEVSKAIENYAQTGADQLSFGMLSTSMSRETCEEAVETFGAHVLKTFDKDPLHSTTKQRLAQAGNRKETPETSDESEK
jgi:alkanesulfonate monooxygenase SsuD/methylene tetrahydromethanopterin reductase-like flavin-dependent oxidoreductase (luciferase family)